MTHSPLQLRSSRGSALGWALIVVGIVGILGVLATQVEPYLASRVSARAVGASLRFENPLTLDFRNPLDLLKKTVALDVRLAVQNDSLLSLTVTDVAYEVRYNDEQVGSGKAAISSKGLDLPAGEETMVTITTNVDLARLGIANIATVLDGQMELEVIGSVQGEVGPFELKRDYRVRGLEVSVPKPELL